MADRTKLIGDLRSRLRDGTTASALIRHILAALGPTISYHDLCAVLQDAFCLPAVRISPSSLAPQHDHRGVVLNKTLLAEIVQFKNEWNPPNSQEDPSGEPSWMDGLNLRTPEEIGKEVRSAPVPGLTHASWAALSPKEQDALYVHLTSGMVLSERVEVFASLVERLQEKVDALEKVRAMEVQAKG